MWRRPEGLRIDVMRTACRVLTITLLALALGACGESSEEKAQSTVCDARADIGTQVDKLEALTPATITTDAVTQPLDAIRKDLQEIAGAQSDLSGDRRSQVEAANKAFTSSVERIARDAVASLSAADAKSSLVTAVKQLGQSYEQAFSPVDCN
jgi:Tfp pilus assembly protein PilP